VCALVVVAQASRASAQAWLPTRGEGDVGLTYGDYAYDGHFASDGRRIPYGGTQARSVLMDVTYGITDRVTVNASLPFVSTRLSGTFPKGVALGPLDDGAYHGDFQDFRFDVHVQALAGSLALAPFVGVNLPSHDYEVVGEAVPGKRLKEIFFGVAAGHSLPVLTRGWIQARYAFAVVERVLPEVGSLNRSNLDFEIGYPALRWLSVRALGAWQRTHGGLDLGDMVSEPNIFRDHDRAARTNYLNLGGGVETAFGRSEVYAAFLKTVSGENAHQARSLYVGVAWGFGGGFGRSGGPPAAP